MAMVKAQGSVRTAVAEYYAAHQRNGEKIQRLERGLSEDDELPPYVYQEYPKMMYPIDGSLPVQVENQSEEAEKASEGYLESKAAADAAYDAPQEESESLPAVHGRKRRG